MFDTRTRNRIGGISAILTLLLFGGGWAAWALPGLPDMNSATSVSAWFVQHHDACRIAATLGSLSLATMITFEVCLYSILRRAEGGDGFVTRAYFGGALLTVVFDLCSRNSSTPSHGAPGTPRRKSHKRSTTSTSGPGSRRSRAGC
jgi:hypothetical protein